MQFLENRTALADIDVADTTIPEGSPVMLALAAGNRDPNRFHSADRFDTDRLTTSTSASAAACTTAMAPRWHGRIRRLR